MKITNLLYTEWLKLRRYWAFWLVLALVLIAYPGIAYLFYTGYEDVRESNQQVDAVLKLAIGSPFDFPEIWHTLAYISSFLVFIPSVLVIMLITNEYQYRTQRQNILDGWSRDQFLWSKLLGIAALTLLLTSVIILVTLVIGWANPDRATAGLHVNLQYMGLFALITFNQLSIAFLIGFLLKRALLALGLFLFYYLIPENVLIQLSSWRWKTGNWYHYLPMEASDRMLPPPPYLAKISDSTDYQSLVDAIPKHILVSAAYTCLLWLFCFWWLRRKDLT